MSDQVGCVVIGAGVVGLAVARALALQGREVIVLEQADGIGTGSSSRNSEVIHAGIYYPEGSLKAKLCVEGRKMLYRYCTERGIPHRRCGKLIVATSAEQVAQLDGIYRKALRNRVDDITYLSRAQAQAMEPALQCEAALHSPSTGILDSHAFMLALQGDLEGEAGMVVCHTQVDGAAYRAGYWTVSTADGTQLQTKLLINAAGYWAPKLGLRFEGLNPAVVPQAYYAKGNYFVLNGKAPFSRLIYPVPEAAGLGVHLTLDLGGQAKFGPDVEWVDDPERLLVNPLRGDAFYDEVRRYWPNLADGDLIAGYAGIRPKISGPNEASADFLVQGPAEHGAPGLINLFGIESPGLTSSLALGNNVAAIASAL